MPHTVLLVEDSATDILLMQRTFRHELLAGVTLQVARDGDAAVSYLSGAGEYGDRLHYPLPALVLLDLKLPRRSGLEVLAWLKQQPQLKRIPVIVLTSSNQRIDLNQAYDLGVNSYLVKPIGFAALLALMQSLGTYWLQHNEQPDLV